MLRSQAQKSVLYGAILGDGFLQKTGEKNARLRLEHGYKQKDFLLWKVKMLAPFFQGKPKYIQRIHPQTQKTYRYWRIQSQAMPYLGRMRKIFYPEGKKQIPFDVAKNLTPISLAVWYMDDGYYYKRDKCSFLYLGNVSQAEAENVQKALKDNFGLLSRVKIKKKGFAIYFSPEQTKNLHNAIRQYVIPLFDYKLSS